MSPGDGSRQRPIYLDYHATTPTDPRVAAVVLHHLTTAFGNASSTDHVFGDEADEAVRTARREIAALIGANPRDVVLTSGATEAINLALQGFVRRCQERGRPAPLVALMPVEHRAVLDTCRALEASGAIRVRWLRVDDRARLDLDDLRAATREGVDLMCIMAANNEVGTVYPLEAVGAIARETGALLLVDATQAAGKIPLDMVRDGIAFLACAAHKLYGPKGVGALVVRADGEVAPLVFGGGHERGLRSGTVNVAGAAGFGEACRLRRLEMATDEPLIGALRDTLQAHLCDALPDLVVNGDQVHRLAGNLHVAVPGVPNLAVVARVRDRLAIATGAACSSGTPAPSHVLQAMRLPEPIVEGALRLGLGRFSTADEVTTAAALLVDAVTAVRGALTGASPVGWGMPAASAPRSDLVRPSLVAYPAVCPSPAVSSRSVSPSAVRPVGTPGPVDPRQ